MPDFSIRSDSVDVEQIMGQIRARIREKRGVDYTEQQLRELAAVKLERFLDPRGVRSDLLERFRQMRAEHAPPDLPNYVFESTTLYETHRTPVRWIRRLLQPILKLFFNPNPLIEALHIQSRLNALYIQGESERRAFDQLYFELIHNLVIETTRLGIEVKNLNMRVESLAGRLEFDERRTRALEGAVVYKPPSEAETPAPAPAVSPVEPAGRTGVPAAPTVSGEGPGQRSRRRRRRRGRRGRGSAAALMGAPTGPGPEHVPPAGTPVQEESRSDVQTRPQPVSSPSVEEGSGADGQTPSAGTDPGGTEPEQQ
jgi:hypothetical protein